MATEAGCDISQINLMFMRLLAYFSPYKAKLISRFSIPAFEKMIPLENTATATFSGYRRYMKKSEAKIFKISGHAHFLNLKLVMTCYMTSVIFTGL